jgi:hypothetical protein
VSLVPLDLSTCVLDGGGGGGGGKWQRCAREGGERERERERAAERRRERETKAPSIKCVGIFKQNESEIYQSLITPDLQTFFIFFG